MSEYMEKHAGLPASSARRPAMWATRRRASSPKRCAGGPIRVVLFDEIEKAHPDIWGILLQIMEDGMVTDAQGRKADFEKRHRGAHLQRGGRAYHRQGQQAGFLRYRAAGTARPAPIQELKAAVLDDLKKVFRPGIA